MKGALIGSTCTGKTTGLAYLTCNLGGLRTKIGIGNEVAVDCPYPLNERGGFLTQWWILAHQIEREYRLSQWFPNVIMDRSVLDSIAYTLVAKDQGRSTEKELNQIVATAKAWMENHPYDFFLYLPPLVNCPLNSRAKDFQEKVDNAINLLFLFEDICNTQIIKIQEQEKDKRNQEILNVIKEVMKLG